MEVEIAAAGFGPVLMKRVKPEEEEAIEASWAPKKRAKSEEAAAATAGIKASSAPKKRAKKQAVAGYGSMGSVVIPKTEGKMGKTEGKMDGAVIPKTEGKMATEAASKEEATAAGVGKKKRTKLVRISGETCELRMKMPPSPRSPACPAFLADALEHITNPKLREHLIARAAMYKAASDKFIDRDLSVRQQYAEKGYAEIEIEVDDEEA